MLGASAALLGLVHLQPTAWGQGAVPDAPGGRPS